MLARCRSSASRARRAASASTRSASTLGKLAQAQGNLFSLLPSSVGGCWPVEPARQFFGGKTALSTVIACAVLGCYELSCDYRAASVIFMVMGSGRLKTSIPESIVPNLIKPLEYLKSL